MCHQSSYLIVSIHIILGVKVWLTTVISLYWFKYCSKNTVLMFNKTFFIITLKSSWTCFRPVKPNILRTIYKSGMITGLIVKTLLSTHYFSFFNQTQLLKIKSQWTPSLWANFDPLPPGQAHLWRPIFLTLAHLQAHQGHFQKVPNDCRQHSKIWREGLLYIPSR